MTGPTVLVGSAGALRRADECCLPSGVVTRKILIDDIDAIDFQEFDASVVIFAEKPAPDAARSVLKRAVDAHVELKLIDGVSVRDLALGDLVGAADCAADTSRIRRQIAGKRVLITGGGGSIGGELARKIAAMMPERLTLLDSSEFNLFKISHELPNAVLALADIRDSSSVRRWIEREQPEIIFHTAALKQVPLVEAFPSEGVLTNVCGVHNVAAAAQNIGATLIFVSTDKAVDPTGVMGASKRLGEIYCQALDRRGATRVVPVRLGNVLGSAGSVVPFFEGQLQARRPLTVTDAEVTRFFMSIPQAANALLRGAEAALSGTAPRGSVLVVDMGEPLPIVELARAMIRLEGLRPDVDLPIVFTGLRPGERLHEQLISAGESVVGDAAVGVTAVSSAALSLAEVEVMIAQIRMMAGEGADADVRSALFEAVAQSPASPLPLAIAD